MPLILQQLAIFLRRNSCSLSMLFSDVILPSALLSVVCLELFTLVWYYHISNIRVHRFLVFCHTLVMFSFYTHFLLRVWWVAPPLIRLCQWMVRFACFMLLAARLAPNLIFIETYLPCAYFSLHCVVFAYGCCHANALTNFNLIGFSPNHFWFFAKIYLYLLCALQVLTYNLFACFNI